MRDRRELWFHSYLPTNMAGGCFDTLLPIFVILGLYGNVGDIALVSVSASAASVPALIFWGRATDSIRYRKHFVVFGFLGRAIAYTIMGASVTTGEFLFANIMMGLLASASTPAMSIMIFELFSPEKVSEKIGLFNKIAGIGNLAGIALGTVWLALIPPLLGMTMALRLLFFINALLAIIGTYLALLLIIEPEEKTSRRLFREHVLELVRWTYDRARYLPDMMYRVFRMSYLKEISNFQARRRTYITWFMAATFMYNVGAVAFFTIVPVFLLKSIGMSSTIVFFLFFVQALVSTLLFTRIGRLSDRGDKATILFLAKFSRATVFALYAVSVPLAAWSPDGTLVFLIMLHAIIGITWAAIADTQMPLAVDAGRKEEKGSIAGLFNAVVGIGTIAGGAVAGILSLLFGFVTAMMLSAVFVAVGALVVRLYVPKKSASASGM